MNNSQVVYTATFNHLPILADEGRRLGCHGEILQRLGAIFAHATSKHNKVFFLRFDLRMAEQSAPGIDINVSLPRFINSFTVNLKRGGYDPFYLWVREQASSIFPHFHFILLLDGNKTQSIYGHLETAERLWNSALGIDPNHHGLVDYCTRDRNEFPQDNGIMIRRNDPDFITTYQRCFQWASYLAKASTKGNAPEGVHEFGCSRLG